MNRADLPNDMLACVDYVYKIFDSVAFSIEGFRGVWRYSLYIKEFIGKK